MSETGAGPARQIGEDSVKVLYVLSQFPSVTTTFVTNEMTGLERNGAQVEVASAWPSPPGNVVHDGDRPFMERTLCLFGPKQVLWGLALLPYFCLTRPRTMASIAGLLPAHCTSLPNAVKFLACLPKALLLARHCRKRAYHVLHAHFLSSAALIAMIASWLSDTPFTVTAHAYDIYVDDPRTFPPAVPRKCRESMFVVVVHRFGRDFMLSRFPSVPAEKLRVLHIGIDPDTFDPSLRAQKISQDRAGRPVAILSNGSMAEKKGHDVLVESVRHLRDSGHDVHLQIIGGGDPAALLSQIRSLGLGDFVGVAGAVPQAEVRDMLGRADVFALACKKAANGDMDGIPTVLLEALAMGVPVVTTGLSGIPELVTDGDTGFLAEPGDPHSFAAKLAEALADPQGAAETARRGRERVLSQFSARTNAGELARMWRKALGSERPPE
jgi:glycosyltransferase involved in cell wall biosynthesis